MEAARAMQNGRLAHIDGAGHTLHHAQLEGCFVMKISRQSMFMVLMVCAFQPGAAQEQTPPAFVGPGPSGEELAAMPQTPGAKGDQERHYYFEEAGREMGYHLYVPESYDPAVGAPLVVALHGFGVNYKFFLSVVPQLTSLCEQYGFICVAPMGYTISGWYGAPMTIPGAPPPGSGLPIPQRGIPLNSCASVS
jgi:hypothetical protein